MASSNNNALILPAPTPVGVGGTNEARDIREIKDPVQIGAGWFWLWVLLGALAVAAFIYWWRKRPRPVAIDPALLIPPHRRAKERLRGATELLSDPYAFCSLVSDVTRVYLEERYRLHAPDRTTEEFLEELRASSPLRDEHKLLLEDFLTRCDLVKFAQHEPTEPELRALLDAALRLIDETQEVAKLTSATAVMGDGESVPGPS